MMNIILGFFNLILNFIGTFFNIRKPSLSSQKAILLCVIFVIICFGIYLLVSIPTKDPSVFSDVKVGDWYYDAVTFLYDHNLVDGTGGKRFSPGESATRATVITILYHLEGNPEVEETAVFSDTPLGQYYSKAVCWAANNEIVAGDNGVFYPDEPIPFDQIAVVLHHYHERYKGRHATNDVSVNWAVQRGLFLDLIDDDADMSRCTATRAQVAVIFMRYCESVGITS